MNSLSTKSYQAIVTPLLPLYDYQQQATKPTIYLKAENLQPFGSYKIRGIANVFKSVPIDILKHGVSAASAGNMGQSLAYMAKAANIPCTIYVPEQTPSIKKSRIKALGATLIELPFDELWQYITNPPLNRDKGLFIHPIFTKELLEGYQDIAKELIQQLPEVDAVVVPLGIGGLSIAICNSLQKLKPDVAVYTCEPETASPMHVALAHGSPVKTAMKASFVDAIGTPEVLPEVYRQLESKLSASIVVSIAQAKEAISLLLNNNKLLCEGAAGCSVAAGKILSEQGQYQAIACILTGGNLDHKYYSVSI